MDRGSKITVPLDREVIYANEAHALLDQEIGSVLSEVHIICVKHLFKESWTVVRFEQDPWPVGHVVGIESLAVDHPSSSHIQHDSRPDEGVERDAIYGQASFKIVCRRIHVSAQVGSQGHDGKVEWIPLFLLKKRFDHELRITGKGEHAFLYRQ